MLVHINNEVFFRIYIYFFLASFGFMQPLKTKCFEQFRLKLLNTVFDSVREAIKKGTIEFVIIPDRGGWGGPLFFWTMLQTLLFGSRKPYNKLCVHSKL